MTTLMLKLRARAWRRARNPRTVAPRPAVTTRAERAECTCPEACERDHELD